MSGQNAHKQRPADAFAPESTGEHLLGTAVADLGVEDAASSRPPTSGLITSILSGAKVTDEGALAALRTLPRRAAPDPDHTDPVDTTKRVRGRIALLLELALDKPDAVQGRLLIQAAELLQQLGDHERAQATYAEALARDPKQRLAFQQLYRRFVRRGDWAQAAQLLEHVCQNVFDARERSLALCARAQLATELGAPAPQLIELLERARSEQPTSLLPSLLLARQLLSAGRWLELAQVLCDAAEQADVVSTRALLLLEAGRVWERSGELARAQACYEQALETDSKPAGAQLGVARVQLARHQYAAANTSLAALAALDQAPELSSEWTRQRGLLLLEAQRDAAQAARTLQAQHSAPGLRALGRAAELAQDHAELERALGEWAKASGGLLRNLAAAEQARARRRTRHVPTDRPGPVEPNDGGRSAEDALREAALLCAEPDSLASEHQLLAEVSRRDSAFLEADILRFDVAAELAELPELRAALSRDAERWPDSLRAGSLIAALDLEGVDHSQPELGALWQALAKLSLGQPVVTRFLAARAPSPEQSAQLWLSEALATRDAQAAFAATTAGHYLEAAGLDPTEAYLDALDARRGYVPAAFGMELCARAQSELSALERVHRELADTTASPKERSARYVRLGLLNADTDLSAAAHWLRLAEGDAGPDAVLDELSIRLAMDQSPAHQAELLESAAERQSSPAYARAMRLQAAEAHEAAGQWDDAVRVYRQQLAESPQDIFADCALMSCLRRRGRPAMLAAELERRARECDEPDRRAVLLEEWAQAELALGQTRRGHALLQQAVAERTSQASIAALRALKRHAMQAQDQLGIMQYAQQLSEALEERVSSAAELRLCVRVCRQRGSEVYAPLMAAEGRVRESWYARELEALASRNGDKARLYEALCLQTELTAGDDPSSSIERAAYALRAAEVLELTAPERPARDLANALGTCSEHPFAAEQLARLYKAAGDTLAAAHTFARAARMSSAGPRAAALYYTAGVLFQDELDEPTHAIENLQKTAKVDLLFADTFTRLQVLLKQQGRSQELLSLLELRLDLQHEPQLAAQLHFERYLLLVSHQSQHPHEQQEQDDPQDLARQALLEALAEDPGSTRVLLALGELQQAAGEYADAAQTWTRLSELLDEPASLAEAHARLGVLYRDHLGDPQGAEQQWLRALSLFPEHATALSRLAELYIHQGRLEAALDATGKLLDIEPAGSERESLVIQHAQLRYQLGDHEGAVGALEAAQRLAPTSMPLLRAHQRILLSTGAQQAREAVLLRGCHALRSAIETDPSEVRYWLGLHELLGERGAHDAAAVIAHAARTMGHNHPELADTPPRGLGAQAFSPAVLAQVAPSGALRAVADLMRTLSAQLDPHLPFEQPHAPIAANVARDLAPEVTSLLGVDQLRFSQCDPDLCLPLTAAPLHVCLGKAWLDRASKDERTFGLLRAVALAKLDLHLLARSAPERFGLVLNALWSIADRTHMVVVLDAAEQSRVAAELSDSLHPSEHTRVKSLIDAVIEQEEINPRRLQSAAFDYGARVALCATGDLGAGLRSLLLMRGKLANQLDPREKLELCRTDPALRGLLSFAVSEQHMKARTLAHGSRGSIDKERR